MTNEETRFLDRPVDEGYDHILGSLAADITLVEYGSYDCGQCRLANEKISEIRDQFGRRIRYIFRHRPVPGSDIAHRAAVLVERAPDADAFWTAHVTLMTRSQRLTEEDLAAVARELGVAEEPNAEEARHAAERVSRDVASAASSGVRITPTFFINGRRYDGPWDESSFADALLGSLGHRVRSAALDFASWAPSTGALLLLASILAVVVTNSAIGPRFEAFWERYAAVTVGGAELRMSLRHWVNDALLCIFFLVVGLEIKREFTVGHLAGRRSAALPIAAALGGMIVPVALYVLAIPGGAWSHGWGVPMATDTAFAVALIVTLGHRVPVELRIFLTAAAIVDDIGAILVVAFVYSGTLDALYLAGVAAIVVALGMLNRWGVYRAFPYLALGAALWFCVHAGGLHATLAGVLLAFFIPTRPPPDLRTLMVQADALIAAEARHGDEVLRRGPSPSTLQALDAIHDRIESPADRMLRHVEPWSSYVVLPLFALANAGVVLNTQALAGREPLLLAIIAGLVIGKPLGMLLLTALAVRLGVAIKPAEYSWMQLAGAGSLAGIGFTMSLFIAGQAFPTDADFAAAKIAIFSASLVSAVAGVVVLWRSHPVRQVEVSRAGAVSRTGAG